MADMSIDDEDIPANERFGFVFAVIFLGLGAYWLFTGWMLGAICALALGLFVGLLANFYPASLRKPNLAWALIGLVLGKVVGTIVMGLIFFTIITPMALFFRITGRDELRLRRSKDQSYWRLREDASVSSKFSDQF